MIISVYGDSTRQGWLHFLPRQCRVTSAHSRQPGELIGSPPCSLAVLAAVMRNEPGKNRGEMRVWDLHEDDRGTIVRGTQLDADELRLIQEDKRGSHYMLSVAEGKVRPEVVVIDPAEEWYGDMVLYYIHDDPQYALSLRERRIAETLYWVQREADVVLVSNERTRVRQGQSGYEPNLPPAILRQCDLIIHVEQGIARLQFQREHVAMAVDVGEEVTEAHVLDVFGFLAEPVLQEEQ